jgi:hypothetical protein
MRMQQVLDQALLDDVQQNNIDNVRDLLKEGARRDATDSDGTLASVLAFNAGHLGTAELLLSETQQKEFATMLKSEEAAALQAVHVRTQADQATVHVEFPDAQAGQPTYAELPIAQQMYVSEAKQRIAEHFGGAIAKLRLVHNGKNVRSQSGAKCNFDADDTVQAYFDRLAGANAAVSADLLALDPSLLPVSEVHTSHHCLLMILFPCDLVFILSCTLCLF